VWKALSRTQQILQNSAHVMASRCAKGEGNAATVTRSGRKITASRKLLFDQVSPLYYYHLCLHMFHDCQCCWLHYWSTWQSAWCDKNVGCTFILAASMYNFCWIQVGYIFWTSGLNLAVVEFLCTPAMPTHIVDIDRCPSVCLYCVEMAASRIIPYSPHDRPIIRIFCEVNTARKF